MESLTKMTIQFLRSTQQNEPELIETISESDNLNIEETLVDTPTLVSNR